MTGDPTDPSQELRNGALSFLQKVCLRACKRVVGASVDRNVGKASSRKAAVSPLQHTVHGLPTPYILFKYPITSLSYLKIAF